MSFPPPILAASPPLEAVPGDVAGVALLPRLQRHRQVLALPVMFTLAVLLFILVIPIVTYNIIQMRKEA